MPPPTTNMNAKTAPTLKPGIFVGYRLPPGGRWAGDYLVVDIDKFNGLSLHTDAEPGLFANCRPQITRTVKWTKYECEFPLFQKSIQHTETLEGIEMAMLQVLRERRRRKRLKQDKLSDATMKKYEEFAKVKKAA